MVVHTTASYIKQAVDVCSSRDNEVNGTGGINKISTNLFIDHFSFHRVLFDTTPDSLVLRWEMVFSFQFRLPILPAKCETSGAFCLAGYC